MWTSFGSGSGFAPHPSKLILRTEVSKVRGNCVAAECVRSVKVVGLLLGMDDEWIIRE